MHPTQWPVCTAYGNYVYKLEVSLVWHFSILWNATHLACVCVCVCVCMCMSMCVFVCMCEGECFCILALMNSTLVSTHAHNVYAVKQ